MNEIGYDQWQAMNRLPYLILLATCMDQRGYLHRAQITCLLERLAAVYQREPDGLLGQLAEDGARELVSQFQGRDPTDTSHFPLACARTLDAARRAMDNAHLARFVHDALGHLDAVGESLPGLRRLLARLTRRHPNVARATLRRALCRLKAGDDDLEPAPGTGVGAIA